MKILLFTILCISTLNSQIDTNSQISKETINSAFNNYMLQGKNINDKSLCIDIQSILIDFIPFIVKKDRKIRYKWDKYQRKHIYVYRHLIKFDSIDVNTENAFSFRINKASIDTSFTLKKIDFLGIEQNIIPYSNLSCFHHFNYKFVFVNDIIKADFVVSTIKKDNDNNSNLLYIWHIPNLSESITYFVGAEMPWDVDCYKVQILSELPFSINLKLKELEALNKIRNQR